MLSCTWSGALVQRHADTYNGLPRTLGSAFVVAVIDTEDTAGFVDGTDETWGLFLRHVVDKLALRHDGGSSPE